MKKLLLLILVLAVAVCAFAACNKDKDNADETTAATTVVETEGTTAGDTETTTTAGETEATTTVDTEGTSAGETEGTTEEVFGEPTVVEDALAYIHQLYRDMKADTASSYDLVKIVEIGDVVCNVVWTIEGTDAITIVDKNDNMVTVVIPELGSEAIEYTLKATITVDGETGSKSYAHVVPKFKVTSFAEYAAAANGDSVIVEGIVTGIISKSTGSAANGLYLQDLNGDGGYYVYNLPEDPNGTIEVGMTVQVSGSKDLYNGTYEVVDPAVKIISTEITTVTPVDYTEILAGAAALNDAALVAKQGMLVTVKGVTVGEVGDNGYYYFILGNHKTYLRISSSNNPTTSEALATIKDNFAANYGSVADVTGVISIYNGNFYLSPVSADAFANFQMPERSDAEKAEFELGAIKVDTQLNANKTLTLPTVGATYADVTIAWTSNSEYAVVDGGNVTVTIPDTATDIVLTATATCNGETSTKEFAIKLTKTLTSIKDALALAEGQEHNTYTDKHLVGGIITEIASDVYGNCYITDGVNTIYIYGLYDVTGQNKYEALDVKPQVGDYIVVLGAIGQYNGTLQIKSGWIVTHKTTTSIEDANTLGGTFDKNNYTEDKYLVTGTVKEIQNATYGNIVIEDANGNSILVYGTYDATGANRFDAMATQPKVGDTITVYGIVGYYSAPQLKNAWIVNIVENEPAPEQPAEIPGLSGTTGMHSPDTYRENGVVMVDGGADQWILNNRANNGISGVDNIGFRGWAFIGDGKTVAVKEFGYGFKQVEGITWGFEPIVDENLYAPLEGRTEVRRYDITIDLTGLAAGEYDVILYVKDAEDNVYVLDRWVDVWVKVEAVTPDEPTTGTTTIADAIAIGSAKEHDTYTEEKYTITATVKDVYNTTYGNMHIVDANGNELTVYGTYSADGSVRYDAMDSKPVAGDTNTVYGVLGQYNGTPQMKNAWIMSFSHEHKYADATCTEPKTCSCGATTGEPNGHTYENGACKNCGAIDPDAAVGGDTTPVTASKTIASLITELGWTNTTTKQTFKLDDKVTVKVNGGSNTGKAYNGDHIRVYATDTPAGTLTISVPEGYELVTVKVTTQTGTYAFLCVDGSNEDISNKTVNVSGNSVVLNSVKNGSDGKQVRVMAIEVVYKLVG